MEKKKLGGLLLALWLAVLPLYGAMCFADTADDKRAELNDVRQRMERMQTRKEQARRKAESASAELSEVMGSLNELQAQANNLQKKSDTLQGKINDNQAKLEKKQQEMQARMLIYRKRLRDIYINGQINYLDVLLGAKDSVIFPRACICCKNHQPRPGTVGKAEAGCCGNQQPQGAAGS